METLGSILKSAREKKGLSIQDLELTTHIVSKYIKALEEEKFDELPGEIYLKGFVKNISDKLGLKSNDMLELYRLQKNGMLSTDTDSLLKNQTRPIRVKEKKTKETKETVKLQQIAKTQDTSVFDKIEKIDKKDELTEKEKQKFIEKEREKDSRAIKEIQDKKEDSNGNFYTAEETLLMMTRKDIPVKMLRRKKTNRLPFIIISALVVIVVIVTVVVLNRDRFSSVSIPKISSKKESGNVQRNIIDVTAKQNVKSGDIVYFKPLGISANIKFVGIGNIVRANVNGSEISFSKSNPVLMDLNGNGIDDFRMTLVEVYEDLATVQLEKLEENEMVNSVYTNEQYETLDTNSFLQNTQTVNNFPIINGETYLEQDTEKTPIIAEITAKHFVYIRYFIDSDRPATTNLLSGKTLTLEAKDVILLTVGNAAEVVVKINGKIISIGEPGETVNKTIKWVKNVNDSTKFNLVVSDTK